MTAKPDAGQTEFVSRCLSLTQPWATLVAIGAKKWETRSWCTKYRGALAIHASKGFPQDCINLCAQEPFRKTLITSGIAKPRDLPRGQVIAVLYLTDCISTNNWRPPFGSDEFEFGDYSEKRYAWALENVTRIKPFEVKGALGIWRLPRPLTAKDFLI